MTNFSSFVIPALRAEAWVVVDIGVRPLVRERRRTAGAEYESLYRPIGTLGVTRHLVFAQVVVGRKSSPAQLIEAAG